MLDNDNSADAQDLPADPPVTPFDAGEPPAPHHHDDDSIVDEVAILIDDAKTYAEAEIAFQKTRASVAGKNIGMAVVWAIVAIITLHIACLALAVGLVIALQPLVTIWGAIAIVVGVLLLATLLLARTALKRGKVVSALFADDGEEDAV